MYKKCAFLKSNLFGILILISTTTSIIAQENTSNVNDNNLQVSHGFEYKSVNSEINCSTNWRKIALRYTIVFGVATIVYCGCKSLREWSNDKLLSDTEKKLLWHESIISFLLAELCTRNLLCCSAKDEKTLEKKENDTCRDC